MRTCPKKKKEQSKQQQNSKLVITINIKVSKALQPAISDWTRNSNTNNYLRQYLFAAQKQMDSPLISNIYEVLVVL